MGTSAKVFEIVRWPLHGLLDAETEQKQEAVEWKSPQIGRRGSDSMHALVLGPCVSSEHDFAADFVVPVYVSKDLAALSTPADDTPTPTTLRLPGNDGQRRKVAAEIRSFGVPHRFEARAGGSVFIVDDNGWPVHVNGDAEDEQTRMGRSDFGRWFGDAKSKLHISVQPANGGDLTRYGFESHAPGSAAVRITVVDDKGRVQSLLAALNKSGC